jgi:hypothetical protein
VRYIARLPRVDLSKAVSIALFSSDFTAKEAFDEQVDKFIEQNNADLLVILTLTYQPELRRQVRYFDFELRAVFACFSNFGYLRHQLCCIARQSDALDGLADYLEGSAGSSLQLQRLERKHSAHHHVVIYEQGTRKHSRKQVAPIILQYFEAH